MRSEGYCSWVCRSVGRSVRLSVCLSVNRNLTSGASVRPEKDITYSTGNESQKICVDFSEAVPEIHRFLHCMAIRVVGYFGGRACALLALIARVRFHRFAHA